jgi:hypothetical protein
MEAGGLESSPADSAIYFCWLIPSHEPVVLGIIALAHVLDGV